MPRGCCILQKAGIFKNLKGNKSATAKTLPINSIKVNRDISGPEYRWALKMGQRPISYSFTYKNQDVDGPFCILMGFLEKKWRAQESLIDTLQQN